MVLKLPCLRHKIADQIKQENFKKMYNTVTMQSLIRKRNAILHVSFLKNKTNLILFNIITEEII